MALGDQAIRCLKYLHERGYFGRSRRVIEIGAQQLHNRFLESGSELAELGRLFGTSGPLDLPIRGERPRSSLGEALQSDAPMSKPFYQWLGFEYACVDIDDTPDSIPLDLNFDAVPREQVGRYDLVTNFGTTEHVANQLNAMKIIHDLTTVGGVMIHNNPIQGYMNHGLVNYNMKFFWMLARSNGYDWVLANFMGDQTPDELPANIRDSFAPYVDLLGQDPRKISYRAADAGIFIVLKKVFDIPFVPPIDVNTGARTDNRKLAERYWTVFEPNAFETLMTNPDAYKPKPRIGDGIRAALAKLGLRARD
jgi:hypothetical protein